MGAGKLGYVRNAGCTSCSSLGKHTVAVETKEQQGGENWAAGMSLLRAFQPEMLISAPEICVQQCSRLGELGLQQGSQTPVPHSRAGRNKYPKMVKEIAAE